MIELAESQFDEFVLVRAKGRIDHETADQFREQVVAALEKSSDHGGNIIIDLAGIEYVSSIGLRAFMMISRAAKQNSVDVRLSSLADFVQEVMEVTNFNHLFKISPTTEAAAGEISDQAAQSLKS